jgi:hypothetical protein
MEEPLCCFCDKPEPAEASVEGGLVGPVPVHSSQGSEVAAKQLFAHMNCSRASPGFDAGPRSKIPAHILAQFEADGLEGKVGCRVHDAQGFGQHFATELRQEWKRSLLAACTRSGCGKLGASIGCAVKGCDCRVHLSCALAQEGLLIAVPVLMVLRTMRPVWLWLCCDHKYGADPAAWEEELPEPLAGNVCISVEDLSDKLCESLAMLGVLLPLGVLPISEEDGSSSSTKVVFSDTYFYTTVRTVQQDSLLLPLTLPECERDEQKPALTADAETSDSEEDLPVSELSTHSCAKHQKQQQQQQQQETGKRAARVNEYGHPDRRHEAHGLCQPCYKKWRQRGSKPLADFKDSMKAAAAATSTTTTAAAAVVATATATAPAAAAAASNDKVNPKITACPHITAVHKALGKCGPCYREDLDRRKAEKSTPKTTSDVFNKGSASKRASAVERIQLSSSGSDSDEDEPIARMKEASKHASSSSGASTAKQQKLGAQSTAAAAAAAAAVAVVDESDEEHSSASDSSVHASARLATVCMHSKKEVYKKNRCFECYKRYKAAKRSAGTSEQQQQQLDTASDSTLQVDRYGATATTAGRCDEATASIATVQQRAKASTRVRSVYSSDARSRQDARSNSSSSSAGSFAVMTRVPATASSQQRNSSSSAIFSPVTAAMTEAAYAQFPSAAIVANGLPASSLQSMLRDLAQKYTVEWQLELAQNSRLWAAVNATNTPSRVQFSKSSLRTVHEYEYNDLGVEEYFSASYTSEQCDDDSHDDAAISTDGQQDRIKAEQRYPVHTRAQAAEVTEAVRSGGPVYQYTQQQQQPQQQQQQWQRPPLPLQVRQDSQQLQYQQQQQHYANQRQQQYANQWQQQQQQQQRHTVTLQPEDIFVSRTAASSQRPSVCGNSGSSSTSSAKPGRLTFGMGLMQQCNTPESSGSASSDTGFHCSGSDTAYSTGAGSSSVQPTVNAAATISSSDIGSGGSVHEHPVALALVDTVLHSTTTAKAKVGATEYCGYCTFTSCSAATIINV